MTKDKVSTAKRAVILKQVQAAMLKEISAVASNVLAYANDLDDQTEDENYYGALVPVLKALDAVDDLLSELEEASGNSVEDTEPGNVRDTPEETAQTLAGHLTALSDWAAKQEEGWAGTDDAILPILQKVRETSFNAAMGLQDVFMFEDEASPVNQLLLAEMRKLHGALDGDFPEDDGATARKQAEEAFQAEQDIADSLIEQYRLAGIEKPKKKRVTKKKKAE